MLKWKQNDDSIWKWRNDYGYEKLYYGMFGNDYLIDNVIVTEVE